jgi:ABC-type uncharacterized transport system permease subunit
LKPLNIIQWIKCGLGSLAGISCVVLNVDNIFMGVAITILIYAFSDKILKQIFIEKVDSPGDVTKTGIPIFVVTWVFLWVLLYTLLYQGP